MSEAVARPLPASVRLSAIIKQVSIVLGLDWIYEFGRGLVSPQPGIALQHGLFIVGIEKSWHIFQEWRIQAVVLRHARLYLGPFTLDRDEIISLINHFYLYSHFVGTVVFLVWLYFFRRRYFAFVRDTIFIATAISLVIFIVFPMMPPRLMGARMGVPHNYRFVDTLQPLLNYKLQQTQLGYNPYAAMPSLHFAWALILGVTLMLIGRNPLLWLAGLLYPCMMLATILISGNHLLLDAAGSVIVDTIAVVAAYMAHHRRTLRPDLQRVVRAVFRSQHSQEVAMSGQDEGRPV